MHQLLAYFKFLRSSSNQHGVHSPFVYQLITKCFYDQKEDARHSQLQSYRRALLKKKGFLEITDFGSGSKVFSSNRRLIKDLANNAGSSLKRTKLLIRILSYLNVKNVLELGTSLGIATHAMAIGTKNGTITSIEACPETYNFTKGQLQSFGIDNVVLKNGTFKEFLPELSLQSFDVIFFDGHHDKEATLSYFETLLSTAHNDSLFLFDDIHWSPGMSEAWETIKQHPKVTVTIDTFFLGFVFFRTQQPKEHFTIRI